MKLVFYLIFLSPFFCLGQLSNNYVSISNWFDEQVGYDTLSLWNGKNYYNPYVIKTIDNTHVFYNSDKPYTGWVKYNGNLYYNLQLRYDVSQDELVLHSDSDIRTMLLIKDHVAQFKIDKFEFHHLKEIIVENNNLSGYFELIKSKNNIRLYRKNYKQKLEKIINGEVRYKFFDQSKYYLFNNEYLEFSTKKHIIRAFPNKKTFIKNFFKKNKSKFVNDKKLFISELLLVLIKSENQVQLNE